MDKKTLDEKLNRARQGDLSCLTELIRVAVCLSNDDLVEQLREISETLSEKIEKDLLHITRISELLYHMTTEVWHPGHLEEEDLEEEDLEEEPIGEEVQKRLEELEASEKKWCFSPHS